VLGDYTKQPGTEGGKPMYKGGADGSMAAWYSQVDQGVWQVGYASNIGTNTAAMIATAPAAATPDAVPAGEWTVSAGWVSIVAVKCTRP
jgi:hypothetical protein